MPTVKTLLPQKQAEECLIRVAAYCRVSSDSTEQKDSFSAQVEYYTGLRFQPYDRRLSAGKNRQNHHQISITIRTKHRRVSGHGQKALAAWYQHSV